VAKAQPKPTESRSYTKELDLMASLKGLALGVGAIIAVGIIATRTGAAKGISDIAKSVTQTFASPLVGIGGGLKTLGTGVSAFLSPTIAPTIKPIFDWSGWLPFGNGNGAVNGTGNGVRDEDRNGNGNGLMKVILPDPTYKYTAPTSPTLPGYAPRPEDRTNGLIMI